jgi:hypothetical protein
MIEDDFFRQSLPGVLTNLKDIGAFEYDAVGRKWQFAVRLFAPHY